MTTATRWRNCARLYAVAQERYLHVAETMPTRKKPHGMIDPHGH